MRNNKITPLYERLSRDDELQGDSNSMVHQKEMLEEYAKRNGLPNPTHFTDDGIFSPRFDCPGFTAMMEEVNAGHVEAIVIKDMSRLGRDYLKVGQIMEILRQKGIRLIAINDGVDSFNGDDDFTPFRNIMNEWYARDTSKKIRSVFQAKGKSGRHMTGTVIYGYLWDEKREHWLIDEEAAAIVRCIFTMTIQGYGPYQVTQRLNADRVEIPSVHLKENAALFNFLNANGITSMQQLYEKVSALNSDYYAQRGEIVSTERRIAALTERLELWAQYEQHKGTRRPLLQKIKVH